MAQFYASINGQASSQATRIGSKSSGITGHIRGWDIGGRVTMSHENGRDVVRFYLTGGSNGSMSDRLIAECDGDALRRGEDS